MSKVIIIGCGGVGTVCAHKCAQNPDVFNEIVIASRNRAKCDAVARAIGKDNITTDQVDADDVDQLVALLERHRPDMVINLALPYQDLTIMEACLRCGVHYLDTANYEPRDEAHFEYSWQWAYRERFEQAGLTAILGCGFDPGVSGVYTAYAAKHHFSEMYTLDTGHYEQTENVSDMVASLLLFVPELMLHVSRPIRWDSDHVTIMNDQTLDLFKELIRADALDRAHIGLDYFDASINRIGAYIIGTRATQKCLLQALLEPLALLRQYEDHGQNFERLALLEEAKSLPFGAVFDYFNLKNNVPVGEEFIPVIQEYEKNVTSKR